MSWFFLSSLVTFLVAVYIFKNSTDEICYLTGSIAAISLLLILVLAPWQIQCLLLMLVLLSSKRRSLSSSSLVESQHREDQSTQLVYRGANYKPTPPKLEIAEGEITGKYRGQVWKAHNPVEAPLPQPVSIIKYRGAGVTDQKALAVLVQKTVVKEVEASHPRHHETVLQTN